MAVVTPEKVQAFEAVMTKWDVEYSWIGEVTDTGRLIIDYRGEVIVDVDPRTVAHDGPVYERPFARPESQDQLQSNHFTGSPEDASRPSGAQLRQAVLELMASPNLCSKDWVTSQYDHYVQGNTAMAMPDDAGVIRVDQETGLGVALSTDCNGRYTRLDPYAGAQLALGLDYHIDRTWAVGVAVRQHMLLGDITTYPTYTTVFARAEYVWGW